MNEQINKDQDEVRLKSHWIPSDEWKIRIMKQYGDNNDGVKLREQAAAPKWNKQYKQS